MHKNRGIRSDSLQFEDGRKAKKHYLQRMSLRTQRKVARFLGSVKDSTESMVLSTHLIVHERNVCSSN